MPNLPPNPPSCKVSAFWMLLYFCFVTLGWGRHE